jgi:signal peptidase II
MRLTVPSRPLNRPGRLPVRPARAFWPGIGVAAAVAAADQLTKWWIVWQVMAPPRVIEITPFFNLVMAWNPGISFGFFASDSPLNAMVLAVLALLIVIILLVWLYRTDRLFIGSAIGMIVGGAIGNVIDRFHYGAVADFLDFHVAGYHWPAFNLADSMITIGAAMIVLDAVFDGTQTR